MRYLLICLFLVGCTPVSKIDKEPLYTIKGKGVNTGNKPEVTEMEVIDGHIYIY